MRTISFTRHRFPPDIIRHTVWLYARFTLSYRDVEDLLAERGLDISYETVRRWFLKFGAPIARNLRHMRPTSSDYWHLDEMVIVIRRRRHWLWRAVDNAGEVLDFLVQSKRNAKAALKLMRAIPLSRWASLVGPKNLCCLIMLKIVFRTAILRPYELHFIFRDQFPDGRLPLPPFPTVRKRCAASSAFSLPAGATAPGHCVE